jgi:hypothetical protein
MGGTSEDACAIEGGLVVAVNPKTLEIFTALLVINVYVGARFLTRALKN